MRHLDGLGLTAGARGEDHHEGVVGADFAVRDQCGRGGDGARPTRRWTRRSTVTPGRSRPSSRCRCSGSVSRIWQSTRAMSRASAVAAAGGVDAAQHVAAEAGGGQRGQHVRGVAHAARRRAAAATDPRAAMRAAAWRSPSATCSRHVHDASPYLTATESRSARVRSNCWSVSAIVGYLVRAVNRYLESVYHADLPHGTVWHWQNASVPPHLAAKRTGARR